MTKFDPMAELLASAEGCENCFEHAKAVRDATPNACTAHAPGYHADCDACVNAHRVKWEKDANAFLRETVGDPPPATPTPSDPCAHPADRVDNGTEPPYCHACGGLVGDTAGPSSSSDGPGTHRGDLAALRAEQAENVLLRNLMRAVGRLIAAQDGGNILAPRPDIAWRDVRKAYAAIEAAESAPKGGADR